MALTIKHTKVSGIPDGTDPNQVQPSDWNADHAIAGTVGWTEISGKPGTFPATPASTTEVLTGTDTAKAVTPDALAAIWERGPDVTPVAGVATLGEGGYFAVTGSATPITDILFATPKNGREATILMGGVSQVFVHSATLFLPGQVDTTFAPGDQFKVVQTATGTRRVHSITKYSGTLPASNFASTTEVLTGTDTTKAVTPDALAALWEQVITVPTAATIDLTEGGGFNTSGSVDVSAITFTPAKNGRRAYIYIGAAMNFIHSANLYCDGAENMACAGGDIVEVIQISSTVRRVTKILRQNAGLDSHKLASTTEVLTGTNTAKAVTPDALAALWETGTSVPAAASVVLGEGGYFIISGSTAITGGISFATEKSGRRVKVRFTGAPMISNTGSFSMPGGTGHQVVADDHMEILCQGAGQYRVTQYFNRDGSPYDGFASTAEVLTGTDAKSTVTPDALAALWEHAGSIVVAANTVVPDGGTFLVNNGPVSITGITLANFKAGRRFIFNWNRNDVTLVNSAALQIPGGADITPSVGDCVEFWQFAANTCVVLWWRRHIPLKYAFLRTVTILASSTYTTPAHVDFIRARLVGGGGSSGGADATATEIGASGGGASGGYGEVDIVNPAASYTVTIGAGGAAPAAGANNGNTGGATSFGTASVGGGGGGSAGTSAAAPRVANPGNYGTSPANCTRSNRGNMGSPAFKLSSTIVMPGNGGTSEWGHGGRGNTAGGLAGGLGGGGGGNISAISTPVPGLVGGDGVVYVDEFVRVV